MPPATAPSRTTPVGSSEVRMKKNKTQQLSDLRVEYWRRAILLSLQVQHAEIEDAYCTRVSMSELNARISELIWEGAKLKQLTLSEPGSALKKVIWAIHKADENMTWTVIDSSRLHVVYTAWNAEKACAEERRVILHVLDASGSKNPDRILIDGSPDSLTDWLNRCRKEKHRP